MILYLLLGSNLGNRETYLSQANAEIQKQVGNIVAKSSIYQTEAWGNTEQDDYLNQALAVETTIEPFELLEILQAIEKQLGRKREIIWGARTIDIDIIFYDQQIISTQTLTIPHSRIMERKFVLLPLCEIAPDFIHPVWQISVKEMLNICEDNLKVEIFGKTFATTNYK
jgi:2-amino-4-hydroxy-6-hydroxymethyldihydropteridine diphosphokinase